MPIRNIEISDAQQYLTWDRLRQAYNGKYLRTGAQGGADEPGSSKETV
jgi:hypothetical protein